MSRPEPARPDAQQHIDTAGQPAAPPTTSNEWRTVDIVVAAVVAVAFGVVFWAWGLVWNATAPLFTTFPPAQAVLYGVWLIPGVLGMLIVRKPGASLLTAFLAAAVSWLLGSWWGLSVLWYGVLQGLLPEVVFASTRYRRFGAAVAVTAGAAAGLAPAFLDRIFFYPTWSWGWTAVYAGVLMLSSAIIAGYGSLWLVRRLSAAGVLDSFASGRARQRV